MQPLFSFGNRKLPKHTAIFNISSATTCVSAQLGLCQLKEISKCYALKAERMYKAVLPYRDRQNEFWKKSTAREFVSAFLIEKKKKDIKYLRLNESGDFLSQDCVTKADEIAKILWNEHKIRMYCYTARRDLDFSNKKFLNVNGSGFMVDNNFYVAYTAKEIDEANTNPKKAVCGGDCRKCIMCTKPLGLQIAVKAH